MSPVRGEQEIFNFFSPAEMYFQIVTCNFRSAIKRNQLFKGIVSRDFGTLFLISLDRFDGRNRAG
jgi:hypothetical protein